MIRRIGLVLCVVLATVVYGQEKSLLSLELRAYLDNAAPEEFTDLYLRGDVSAIETYVKMNNGWVKRSFDNIVSVSLPNTAIVGLNQLIGLECIEFSSRKPDVLNDVMLLNNNVVPVHAGAAPLSQPYTGSDVIMGFVDSGIELEHPDFQDADGNTRVLYIWDQTQAEDDQDRIPQPYNYGQEYDQQDILEDINVHEDQQEWFGHGSTVTGTGAGNGFATGNFKGVAPDANIIVVSSDFDRTNWTSSVADAVEYIYNRAQEMGKPAVVNLSLGTYFGSHDGLDAAALDIDGLLESTDGFSVVCAAGNSGDTNFGDYHLGYEIPENDTVFTWFSFNPNIPNEEPLDDGAVFFEVWADQEDFQTAKFAMGVDANSPNWQFRGYSDWRSAEQNLNVVIKDTVFYNGNMMGVVETWVGERGDQYQIQIKVTEVFNTQYPWRFATTGGGVFDCWSISPLSNMLSQNLPSLAQYGPMVNYRFPDNLKTIVDSWNCSDKVISVGNYVNRSSYPNYLNQITTLDVTPGEIASSSSRGPTRDNRQKPTIAATGAVTLSSGKISSLNSLIATEPDKVAQGGWHYRNGGTSMASPVVAGIAALYYECNPNANYQDIIDAVVDNAMADQFTGALPGLQFGHGKVNAYGVITDCEALLSVNDPNGNSKDFKVFPNPSTGQFTIRSSQTIQSVEVYSLSGQIIKSIPMSGGSAADQYNIDLSGISSGLYVLKAIDLEGSYNTSRVLIEK
jgi:hypothetical protein